MNNNMNTTMNKLSHSLFAAGMLAVLTTACSSSEEKPDEKPTQAAQEKVETVAVLLGDADKLASKDQLEEALWVALQTLQGHANVRNVHVRSAASAFPAVSFAPPARTVTV